MRLIRFSSKNDECWAHAPAVKRAIEAAGVAFHQKAATTVAERCLANFLMEDHPLIPLDQQNTTAVWYIWDDEARCLRGHLVALQGEWDGSAVCFIYQIWVTPRWSGRRDPVFRALPDTAAVEVDHYARSRGADRILMYTLRPSRFWRLRWGYHLHRFMYAHEVPRD